VNMANLDGRKQATDHSYPSNKLIKNLKYINIQNIKRKKSQMFFFKLKNPQLIYL
jgi:hypothetical protein